MDVNIYKWNIRKLIKLYDDGNLNLNPPYQRNDIWSSYAKKLLIDSALTGFPIPNFILYERSKGKFDMVDGQQRTRTLLGFNKGILTDTNGHKINSNTKPKLLNYQIPVIFVSKLENGESIEEVYDRINSTGLKLNRPELMRAQYFETTFLKLIESLAADEDFSSLGLFTESAINRMNDVDFTGELVSILKYGLTEKKTYVDKLFESDITMNDFDSLTAKFATIIDHFKRFNKIFPIKNTRYRQRNDFYTYLSFINKYGNISEKALDYFYKVMVIIDKDISPSNEDCQTMQDYAFNCVSQSNSKDARKNRLKFFEKTLLNKKSNPNEEQKDIMEFYKMTSIGLKNVNDYYTLNISALNRKVKNPVNFN